MVPGRLLPLAPAELLHQRDRSIPRGRPRAVPRDVRRPGRWDDDRRTPRPRRFVDGDRVIGGVSGDAHERTLDRSEQIEGGGRIIACPSRIRCQAATGSWTKSRQWETQRTLFSSARVTMCPPTKVDGVWPFNDAWLRTSL